ncbi:phospholipase SGR2 isoform X4 [Vigna angularis]|uniref:phospholipase SGR2 isoform X4 n=1 Tax=Phaseolus angularis TaxID=3914 RepID=UPI0022B336CF|nr:phospholipase SGR2 isoform X4 [Vigna angularis]
MAEGEEIRPDLLKNTPSNIARLEDVIEHSKARQKYLAQTSSPSDGGDVRWYFCKIPLAPNELAASVPRTEIVGKSDYFRFGMRDSLAIEASFLQREEELLSSWWREYAECSEGPRERLSSSTKSDTGSFLGRTEPSQLYEIEEERVGVPVKGGLYEVDMVSRHCFPVYWYGENRRVLRGHWFARKGGLDWLPLREDVAEQLEIAYRSQVWHRRTFQPSGLFAARVDLQGSTQGLHALFTGEDDTWEAWLNIDASGFSSFVSFTGNAIKLRRGYSPSNSPKPTQQDELRQQKEEAMDDYCSQVPVRHLVFMVHGIGQRLEKSNLVDDVGNFRHITASLAEQHLTAHQRGTQRVLFIPCQWRKGLKLSGETAVEKITLDGVRGLRVTLSATVHDVLYYMSPIYCQDIIDSNSLINPDDTFSMVSPSEENKGTQHTSPDMEEEYCEESSVLGPELSSVHEFSAEPSFVEPNNKGDVSEFLSDSSYTNVEKKGALDEPESMNVGLPADKDECKVARNKDEVINKLREEIDSLKAELESRHSINQTEEELHSVQKLSKKSPSIQDAPKSYTPYIKYTKLQFEVDTFFAVGSPLGVFLALRNIRIGIGKGQEYWEQENIREEMPACRQLFNIFHPYDPVAYRIEPLVCKEYISQRPVLIPYHRGGKRLHIGFQEFTEDLAVRTHSVKNYMISARDKVITLCQSRKFDNSEGESSEEEEETSYGSFMIERLTGSKSGRIDHMLQDKTFEHPYLQAIGAHTNYWRDYDTALFILKHLYRDTPEDQDIIEDPDLSIVSSMDKSKHESTSVGWYEPRDTIEEDLPLTFSDKVMVRSFSSKAKKVLQKHTAPNY